ncbi:S1C family serine protease [Paenibacillus chitinolyticus]|uniref:S1C family serine protease n=1 Tax=Paenibacillus chitinolyticus TaxID=79263 RepID=UPI003CFC66DC
MLNRNTFRLFGFVLAIVLAAASGFGFGTPVRAAADSDELPQIIARTSPSVVAIIGKPTGGKADKGTDKDRYDLAHGTGVIIKSNGVIVTNAHVVKSMSNLVIVTSDGKSHTGKVTNLDEQSDLALVKIEATGLQTASFADPKSLRVGETVVAIGTPVSFALRNSVTVGIVSGIDRSVNDQYRLIQTDAAINPGNSGGALVNMKGEVVGINTLKYSEYGVDNLGFAIPVDTVDYVLKHFEAYGKVKRPFLGLKLEESWEAAVGLPSDDGLTVSHVEPGSPAEKAGIEEGDTLVSIGGKAVDTTVQYNEVLKQYLPGQSVKLTVQAGGKTVTREVALGEEKSEDARQTDNTDNTGLNTDRGKTKIGDSSQSWSMKYPSGLIKQFQSADGTVVRFADAKGDFTLSVSVEDQGDELSPALLLKTAGELKMGTILEKQYVKSGVQPYAKVTGKLGGMIYQIRLYQDHDKLYTLALTYSQDKENGTKAGPNSYGDLLDSFRTVFDRQDAKLKDIAKTKSGGGDEVSNEYGLTFALPDKWNESPYRTDVQYSNDTMSQGISIEVTSQTTGDTLDAWVKRDKTDFEETFAPSYRETSEVKQATLDGMESREVTFSATMGDKWESIHRVYLVKEGYKYKFSIHYPKELKADETDKLLGTVISSIRLDVKKMDAGVGFIQDEQEILDKNRTIRYVDEDYGYTVKIPETWTRDYAEDYDDSRFEKGGASFYTFTGGYFAVDAEEGTDWQEKAAELNDGHEKSAEADADYKVKAEDVSLLGTTVRKFTVHYSVKKVGYEETEYVLSRNGKVYVITTRLNDAVHTEANAERLKKAVRSMVFGK